MTGPTTATENLYEILGVSEEATTDEIKRAYVRLVRKNRPDQHPELFRRINQAKDTLADPQRRREYDQMRLYGDQVNDLIDRAEAEVKDNPQKAVRLLKEAVAITPELFTPRYLLAQAFIQTEDFISAEAQLRRLLQKEPENASLHYNLGGCLKRQGLLDAATDSLQHSLTLNPHYHDALILLSRVYLDRREITEAVNCLERAIQLNGSEDVNDVPVLLQLLTVHLVVDNGPEVARTQSRIHNTLRTAEDAHFAMSKVYDLAFEFAGAGNYADAYKVIQVAQHPLVRDPKLREAIDEAVVKIGVRADASRLIADPQIPKSVQAYIVWKYLDDEGKLNDVRDRILQTMEQELSANPNVSGSVVRYVRNRFPRLAAEEADFLKYIESELRPGVPVGGQVMVQPAPEKTSSGLSPVGCALMVVCGLVGQLVIPVPVVGFIVGLFIGAMIATALKL